MNYILLAVFVRQRLYLLSVFVFVLVEGEMEAACDMPNNVISLRGSTGLVREFFEYSINWYVRLWQEGVLTNALLALICKHNMHIWSCIIHAHCQRTCRLSRRNACAQHCTTLHTASYTFGACIPRRHSSGSSNMASACS
jgi:hypothetical protein